MNGTDRPLTIDEIREIVISPDAVMKKAYGQILLEEIDRLTKLLDAVPKECEKCSWKARAEKAEAELNIAKQKIANILNIED